MGRRFRGKGRKWERVLRELKMTKIYAVMKLSTNYNRIQKCN